MIAQFTDSPYRKMFSEEILKLNELGILTELKDKWWKSDISNDDKKFMLQLR